MLELMLATTIISIAALGLMSTFGHIQKSVQMSKSKSLATNLTQEKIESLKNVDYFRLLVTTDPQTENKITPNFQYDGSTGFYPPEVPLTVGSIAFDRRVYIHKVKEDSNGDLVHVDFSDADTGLKEIRIFVIWKQGNEWKSIMARNLRDDPDRVSTDATFSGNVDDDSFADLQDVKVEVLENSAWNDATDSSGDYSFNVTEGTYTLRASKAGYFSASEKGQSVDEGEITIVNFALVKMDSGTITGSAYIRDHLVISQVVASTKDVSPDPDADQEYIELYNPTTWTWTIDDASFDIIYVAQNNNEESLSITYGTTSIAANGGYYLIANTGTVVAAGTTVVADAVYTTLLEDKIKKNKGGGIKITNDDGSVIYDRVGWSRVTGGSESAPANALEGTAVAPANGLGEAEMLIRSTETATSLTLSDGVNATDTNVNLLNFNNTGVVNQDVALLYPPHSTGSTFAPQGGTPAVGGIVFADDNLSASTSPGADGSFTLISVATGTWTLTVSSGTLIKDTASVTITANTATEVAVIALTTTTTNGFVTGAVTDANTNPLNGIQVVGGDITTLTDTSGNYRLSVATGTPQIVANPNNVNPNYVSAALSVSLSVGQVASNTNFVLSKGAKVRGFSTVNGVDPFPTLIVIAKVSGIEQDSAVVESDGYFVIADLSTGTTVVEARPEPGESVTPSSFTVTINDGDAGTTIFLGTFTVSGALGTIAGTLTENGDPISTGVVVVVSTTAIGGDPPTHDNSLRTGTDVYYSGSSSANGQYSVSVPEGNTYNVYVWYTNLSGSTVRKDDTATVTAATISPVNFTWP